MNWKEFLKPDLRKIVVFIILFISSSFIYFNTDFYFLGFPMSFYVRTPCFGLTCPGWIWGFSLQYLLVDLVIWYLVSCLIVWIYDKVKKK